MIKKYLLITAGLLSLSFGIIGIFFPILPTTPFLLLAAYCFLRSSKKLYCWLMNHKVFGPHIYNYLENKAIKKSAKVSAILLLWPSLLFTMYIVQKTSVAVILIIVGILVSRHVLSLKTLAS